MSSITRTAKMVPFDTISIGSPFYYMDRLWVRTGFESATELHSTNIPRETQRHISTCAFIEDGEWLMVETVEVNYA